MSETLDLNDNAENVIFSYETRIESVGAILANTDQILDDFQGVFLSKDKEEGQKINTQLRDILAQNEHLRKKDFDSMTQGAFLVQEERETEVKNLLRNYLNQQKEMTRALRENLAAFKDALAKGDIQRVKEFRKLTKDIMANAEARKEEVASKLRAFQKEQQEMAQRLKALLAKGRELRIKDLKKTFQGFLSQQKERLSQQVERRKDVNEMLGAFKQERKENNLRKIGEIKSGDKELEDNC